MLKRVLVVMGLFAFLGFTSCGSDSTSTPTDTVQTDTPPSETTDVVDVDKVGEDTTSEAACVPSCDGKKCDEKDSCGKALCGCDTGSECNATTHACDVICVPDACGDKVCGVDSCGAADGCGKCQFGTCAADQKKCDCTPDCTGKDCGANGCGGFCGTDAAGLCANGSICTAGVCTAVGAFGVGSKISTMFIPETAEETGAVGTDIEGSACSDMDGDDAPNNGLGGLLGTLKGFGVDANAEITKMLAEGDINLVLEFPAAVAVPTYGPFLMNGYLCDATATAGEYTVNASSYLETGKPMISMEGAQITAGKLVAGPAEFTFSIPVMGMVLNLKISKAMIAADVVDATVVLHKGSIAGEIYKEDVIAAIEGAKEYCATAPNPPSECSYLDMVTPELLDTFITWDLDDGAGVSACVFMATTAAKITGLSPADAE